MNWRKVGLSRVGLADTIKRSRANMFKARRRAANPQDVHADYYDGIAHGIDDTLRLLRIELQDARR